MILRAKIVSLMLAMLIIVSLASFAKAPSSLPPPGPRANLQYVKITDPSAQVAALLSGEISVMDVPTWADLKTIQAAGFKTVQRGAVEEALIFFNMYNRTVISDVNFRRAIAHLVPKDAILSELWGPLAAYEYNFFPASMGKWVDPTVPDVTTFDPELAKATLDQAGYTVGNDGLRIDPATGKTMRQLELVNPSDWPGPQKAFIERWQVEMTEVGIPAKVEEASWSGGAWWQQVVVEGKFDGAFLYWGWSPDPIIIEWLYHSNAVIPISNYSNPELDEQFSILDNTLNDTEAIAAGNTIQHILVDDLPSIPLYRRVQVMAYNKDLVGIQPVNFLYSQNYLCRWRWKDGAPEAGQPIKYATNADPQSMIVGMDMGIVAATYVTHACEMLVDPDPYTGVLKPWVLKDWTVAAWSDPTQGVVKGSKYTLNLNNNVYWHDGVQFTAADIEFALKYGRDFKLARLGSATTGLVDAKIINDFTIELYYNLTSIFTFQNFAWTQYTTAFPKHLYNPNATIYGQPEGPMGLQVSGKPGVPDPTTFAAPFVKYPNPPADKPWLTCMIGVGPWILKEVTFGAGATFVANANYHVSVYVTDTNYDRRIDILDISAAARSFLAAQGSVRWNPGSDVNGDDKVDILDIASIARDFGVTY